MKLRLQSDGIRVRLSEDEVQRLGGEGALQESITLAPGQALSYRVELAPVDATAASLDGGNLRIRISDVAAKAWVASSDVALKGPASAAGIASVIVERDVEPAHRRRP